MPKICPLQELKTVVAKDERVGYNKDMFIVGLLTWWYGDGWRQRFNMTRESVVRTLDFFSVTLLLKTLFSPFRQISAGKVRGPIGVQLRAFFDQLISRLIGAAVRSMVIFVGVMGIFLHIVWGVVVLGAWAIIPLLPIVGLGLASSGWVPAW